MTTTILIQKDPKTLVPKVVTTQQRLDIAQNYTIYDLNADGTKGAPFGPTVTSGGSSMARTAAQIAATPTAADIAIINGVFLLDTDPTKRYSVNPAGTAYISTSGSGGASVSTDLTDHDTATFPAEVALIAGKISAPTAWAASAGGGTPSLSSGTAVLGAAYKNTTAGITVLSPTIDSISFVAKDDELICLTAGTYTYVPAGSGYPIGISTSTTLTDTYNGANLVCTSTPALTINSGRMLGFGCSIKGAFTTAGSATITDLRSTTGVAYCCLEQSDTSGAGATYDLVGTK